MEGAFGGGEAPLKEKDCPWKEKYSLVSREDLQGKDLEVGTSWFVLDRGKGG